MYLLLYKVIVKYGLFKQEKDNLFQANLPSAMSLQQNTDLTAFLSPMEPKIV